MPSFKGKDGGTWKDPVTIYAKDAGEWKVAQKVSGRESGSWTTAWTDCRLYDAGGSGWSSPTVTTEYRYSCATRESRTVTTRTKTGCANDVRYSSWASSPNCGALNSGCWSWYQPSAGEYQVNGQWFYILDGLAYPLSGPSGSAVALQSGDPCNVGGLYCVESYKIYSCGSSWTWEFIECSCFYF